MHVDRLQAASSEAAIMEELLRGTRKCNATELQRARGCLPQVKFKETNTCLLYEPFIPLVHSESRIVYSMVKYDMQLFSAIKYLIFARFVFS